MQIFNTNSWLFVGLMCLISVNATELFAQGTDDIKPPMQMVVPIAMAGPTSPHAPISFAMAGVTEDGEIEVIQSFPRMVPIDPDDTSVRDVEQTYVVQVPYTEVVDGVPVTRMRQETRTRTVRVVGGPSKLVPDAKTASYRFEDIKCFSTNGKPIPKEEVERRFAERVPAVIIQDKRQLQPYFEALMKPETVFIILPLKDTER